MQPSNFFKTTIYFRDGLQLDFIRSNNLLSEFFLSFFHNSELIELQFN